VSKVRGWQAKEQSMGVNVSIDRELLEQAMKLSGESSESALLAKALEEYISRRSAKRILDLFGKLDWDQTYDHKRARSRN
jgi:hypothetical protein